MQPARRFRPHFRTRLSHSSETSGARWPEETSSRRFERDNVAAFRYQLRVLRRTRCLHAVERSTARHPAPSETPKRPCFQSEKALSAHMDACQSWPRTATRLNHDMSQVEGTLIMIRPRPAGANSPILVPCSPAPLGGSARNCLLQLARPVRAVVRKKMNVRS